MKLVWNTDPHNPNVQKSQVDKYDFHVYFSPDHEKYAVEIEFDGDLLETFYADSIEEGQEKVVKWLEVGEVVL